MQTRFCNVLNRKYDSSGDNFENINFDDEVSDILNCNIAVEEVNKAIFKAKLGKACGLDNIPLDVFRNDCTISV